MKVSGSHVLRAPRQQVWDALQDPAVLVATIPGCQELEETGEDAYSARVHAGIASVKGMYDGRVQLGDQNPPTSYTLRAAGSGNTGTIDATATVSLTEEGGGTRVDYDAEAVIGGAIAGVGQRVVTGVAKRNAATFFEAVDRHLAGELDGGREATPAVAGDVGRAAAEGAGEPAKVFRRPPVEPSASDVVPLLLAALAGAVIALVGVLVGQRRRA
ncbi:MAG TPA: carbon monoxide dehydrogenase subunit G [Euzebyales bacterium]|nr:carbon monoxide dehydrogenase subunit G [Euzebyales bacterium]